MLHVLILAATLGGASPAPAYPAGFENLTARTAQERALATSPDVAAAEARLRQAAATLAIARGTLGPAAFGNYAQAPQAGTLPGEVLVQRLTTIGVQTTVNDLLAHTPQALAAQSAYAAAHADFLTAQAAERTKVLTLYYEALRANATLTVRDAALRRALADAQAAQIRFAAGDAPRLDITRAQVAAARANADLATAQAARENATEALAVETGTLPGNLVMTTPLDDYPTVPDVQIAKQRALEMRPEVASARMAVQAERNTVRAAVLGVLPAVAASVGYTRGTDSGQHVAGTSVTVQATIPLSGSSGARVKLERARLDEAEAKLSAVERQVSLEVGAAVRNYQAAVRAAEAAARASAAAKAALDATETGYRSGASSSLEIAAARQTYEQAVLDEVSAYYALIQARATVFVLMGS